MTLSSKMENKDQSVADGDGGQKFCNTTCDAHKSESELDLCSQSLTNLNNGLLHEERYHSITTLKLDFNNLSTLPDGLAKCVPNLKVLHANGNNLTCLPDDFGSLTFLSDVELKENDLTCLPKSVQYLAHMCRFQLTGNQLTSLPDDFGEMVHLEELFIDENQLTKLPPTFALMERLRILEAGHNNLSVLPKYFGNLRSLTHLSVHSNKLQEMPDSFCQLDKLVVLDVSSNLFRTLPPECASKSTLEKVFAGTNSLLTVPDWLGQLPELTELCLKENVIGSGLPDDIGKVCKKLRRLDLQGNNLLWLPDSFGELESLEWVHFGSCMDMPERSPHMANGNWLTTLPTSFSQLAHLTYLRLDENHINSLPDNFGCLQSLEYLDLGHNMIPDLPESFGNLSKLRVCLLSINGLQLLPSNIGQLTSLEVLHLDFNELAELPQSFRKLSQLKVLDLYHNKLTELPDFLDTFVHLELLDLGQNQFKMPRSQVPSIFKGIGYKPRTESPAKTWRGLIRPGLIGHRPHIFSDRWQEEEEDEDDPWAPKSFPSNDDDQDSEDDLHSNTRDTADFQRSGAGFDWLGGHKNRINSNDAGGDDDDDDDPGQLPDSGEEEGWDTDQASSAYPLASALPDEENWFDDKTFQGPELPHYKPPSPLVEEENWEEEIDNSPHHHSFIPRFTSNSYNIQRAYAEFYFRPSDILLTEAKNVCNPLVVVVPVEGQFADVEEGSTVEDSGDDHSTVQDSGDGQQAAGSTHDSHVNAQTPPGQVDISTVGDGTVTDTNNSAALDTNNSSAQQSSEGDGAVADSHSGDNIVGSHREESSPVTDSGVPHTPVSSPVSSDSSRTAVVHIWIPTDIHPPKMVRPKYDDPNYQEPTPDPGQFWLH